MGWLTSYSLHRIPNLADLFQCQLPAIEAMFALIVFPGENAR